MTEARLTTQAYWESVWEGRTLPFVQRPYKDVEELFKRYLPQSAARTVLEVGCAPGGWLAYFSRTFGLAVSGIEYAKNAAQATLRNLSLLGIPGEVYVVDFFDYDGPESDIVFSWGFLEHFEDLHDVTRRLCALSRKQVITAVPNVFGINGWISRTLRPHVYAQHKQIDLLQLSALHEVHGMRTLFCDYVGGIRLILPAEKNAFFARHPRLSYAMNFPVRVWNSAAERCCAALGAYPRTRLVSTTLLYIGTRE